MSAKPDFRMTTLYTLMMEFQTGHIPVVDFAKKYLGMDEQWTKNMAAKNKLPFTVFRVGGQKSPWLLDINEAVNFLDKMKQKAEEAARLTRGAQE